jgi:hypothetical protein
MNECTVLGSRERPHSACWVALLCQHWELHNTSVCYHVCLHICDFSMDVKLEQRATSNSAWNSANLKLRLLKWYDVRIETRPSVVRGVSSGMRASREAEHHSKTTRGQGDLPRAQQFGGLCMRIVGEPLRTLLQSLMCHTEQCRQFSHVIWTCTALLQSSYPSFRPPNKKSAVLQFVKSFISVLWMIHPSCRGSSLGTRVGSMGMILTLNNSLRNGRAQDPQDWRRWDRVAVRPRACSLYFSTFEGLCTMNLSPKARPWTLSSTAMFFTIWGRT